MAGAARLAGAILEERLYDSIFERMEGNDDKPAAGFQSPLGRKQGMGEFAQLVVDEDAQRLEDARCRVDLVLGLAWRNRLDEICEIAGRLERRLGAALFDGTRNPPRLLSSPRKPKMRMRSDTFARLTTSAADTPAADIRMSSGPFF